MVCKAAPKIYLASMQTSIYAFKKDGVFIYVGQSVSTASRRKSHISKTKHLKNCDFVILRTCSVKAAAMIESQIIIALKKRGQCSLNKMTRPLMCNIGSEYAGWTDDQYRQKLNSNLAKSLEMAEKWGDFLQKRQRDLSFYRTHCQ